MNKRFANFRGIKKITVLEVHVNEGQGVPSDALYREVYYVKENGEIIGHQSEKAIRQFAGIN